MLRITAAIAIPAFLTLVPMAHASINPTAEISEDVNFNDSITLTFTAPVNADRSDVTIHGPNGPVPTGILKHGSDRTNLMIPVSDNLQPGMYIVHFTAYSTLGQPVTGTSAVTVPDRPSLVKSIGLPSASDVTGR